MKMEIAFPSKQRCLPVTCHNVVLFQLLKRLPRVLAELCEEYRISFFDQSRDEGLFYSHDCGVHMSFYCAFKSIGLRCHFYTRTSGQVRISLDGIVKQDIFVAITSPRQLDTPELLKVAMMGRSALDVLADMRGKYSDKYILNLQQVTMHDFDRLSHRSELAFVMKELDLIRKRQGQKLGPGSALE